MKLSEKIIALRKQKGMSQEQLAEKLGVSRQAISRWELGTTTPDVIHVLHMSDLFGVTTDSLLREEYDIAQTDILHIDERLKTQKTDPGEDERRRKKFERDVNALIKWEVFFLFLQVSVMMVSHRYLLMFLSLLPMLGVLLGFQHSHRKYGKQSDSETEAIVKKFYKWSAWLGLYGPFRLIAMFAIPMHDRWWKFEALLLGVYLVVVKGITDRIYEE